MPIPIRCPSCKSSYKVADDLRGKRLRCRECGEPITVAKGKVEDVEEAVEVEEELVETAEALEAAEEVEEVADDKIHDRKGRPAPAKPTKRLRDDRYEDAEVVEEVEEVADDKVHDRKGRPVPAQTTRRLRDERYADDESKAPGRRKRRDDDEEQSKSKTMVFVLCGLGAVLLIGGAVAFFMFNKSRDDRKPDDANVAQNNPRPEPNPNAGVPQVPQLPQDMDPEEKGDVGNKTKEGNTIKDDAGKKPPAAPIPPPAVPPGVKEKEDPRPPEAPPVAVGGGALDGQKLYQRLLKSAVWIKSKQNKGLKLLIPTDTSGQAPANLIGTAWFGKERHQTDSIMFLKFVDRTTVILLDEEDMAFGKWTRSGSNVTASFFSDEVVYTGTLQGTSLSGTAKSGTQTWNWALKLVGGQPGGPGGPPDDFPGPPGDFPMPPGGPEPPPGFRPGRPNPGGLPSSPPDGDATPVQYPPKGGKGAKGGPKGGSPSPGGFPGGGNFSTETIYPVGTGSGALVDRKHRLILTNVHVVGDPKSLTIYFPEYEKDDLVSRRDAYKKKQGIPGKVVMQEPRCDIALVQLERLPEQVAALPFSNKVVSPAQPVHSIGNPGASSALWIYTRGTVRQRYRDKWESMNALEGKVNKHDGMKIVSDSPVNPGDSGGPLVNDRGALIGVAHAISTDTRGFSFFIDLSECRALMEKYFKSIGEKWVPEPEPVDQEALARLPSMIKKLTHQDFGERVQAAQALGAMGDGASVAFGSLFQGLKDENPVVRRAMNDALEKVPPHKDDRSMLLDACKDTKESQEVRLLAMRSLMRLGPDGKPAVPVLAELLKEEPMRRQALEALLGLGLSSKEVPAVAGLLKSGSVENRALALTVLKKAGRDARSATPQLVALLKDRDLRIQAAQTIEAISPEPKEVSAPLLEMLKDGDRDVGLSAAQALIKFGEGKNVVPFLLSTLKNGDVMQRQASAKGLAAVGPAAVGPAAKPVIVELLNAFDQDAVRPHAAEALVRIGKPAIPMMEKRALSTNNAAARLEIINALVRIGAPTLEAIRTLQTLSQQDPVEENKKAAAKALAKLRGG